jgi:hypothetical protein
VTGDALAALVGQCEPRVGLAPDEALLDRHEPGVLELRQVAGQVALGQPGRALHEEEVRIARRGEDREDRQAARFVDEPVEREISPASADGPKVCRKAR